MTLHTIQNGSGRVGWAMKIEFPGSNTLRLADSTFMSLSDGCYLGKVVSWGGLDYSIGGADGALSAVETTVTVFDPDRTIAMLCSGRYKNSLRGSTAKQWLASPDVPFASWPIVFNGVVTKIGFPSPIHVSFTMRTNDERLSRDSPLGGWILNKQSFPLADPAVYGKPAPICYGTHDVSALSTGPGMIPTLLVDKTNYRYLVCAGKAKTIILVYKDGVSVSGATWSTEYLVRDGRIYTCILFSSGFPTADQVVTCDVDGYETVGDGSGSVIYNPALQFQHRLTNFVLGDYKQGSWLSTNQLLSAEAVNIVGAYFDDLGVSGTDYDNQVRTGLNIISRFCVSWGLRSFWTRGGQISIRREDPFAAPYLGARIKWYVDDRTGMAIEEEDLQVKSRITVNRTPSASQGVFLSSFEVVDAGASIEAQSTMDLILSEAE